MHQHAGAHFKSITIDIAGPFTENDRERDIAMDYFTKWPEVQTIPNPEALTVADTLVTTSSAASASR